VPSICSRDMAAASLAFTYTSTLFVRED